MEISRLNRGSNVKKEDKININSKKDFSQSFSFAREQKSEEELKNMLQDIKKNGERLCITKSYRDVLTYKNRIREYLKAVLNHMYEIKRDTSFWQTQYFITVDIVDKKLEELTQALFNEEKDKINVAATVDYISGLVVDIYK